VRGIGRYFASLSLRDSIPFGGLGHVGHVGHGGATSRPTKRLLRTQLGAGLPGHASFAANDPVPDRNVLDYRMLEGLRLVFGEIYADH
jgi:hypothetical protein